MLAVVDDRFEIIRQVGAGGFGTVYLGRDRFDGAEVAIKLLHVRGHGDDGRFDREASLLAQLHHPSIVRHVAHGRSAGRSYLVMEWLQGHTIDKRLKLGRLSIPETVLLARRIADGLAAAAAVGVVHRDIKPTNLFLVNGEIASAKLVDFGLARRIDGARDITRTGMLVGTPLHVSRASTRRSRARPSQRRVLARQRAVRVPDRLVALRERHHHGHAGADLLRGPAPARHAAPRHARGAQRPSPVCWSPMATRYARGLRSRRWPLRCAPGPAS